MSIRTQLKVPRYGLFYFECDKTVSIVPLKKITKVIEGDNTSKGSLVEVEYGNEKIRAQIVAVNDDKNVLKESEIDFLCDPSNKELFSSDDEDDIEWELQTKVKETRKRSNDKQCLPKEQEKKPKLVKKENSFQPKKTGTKVKEQAKVVARFQPDEEPQRLVHSMTQDLRPGIHSPKSPITLPSSPLYNTSPLSSIYLSRNIPIHSTPARSTPQQHVHNYIAQSRPLAQRNLSSKYNEGPSSSSQASDMLWLLTRIENKIDQLLVMKDVTSAQIETTTSPLQQQIHVVQENILSDVDNSPLQLNETLTILSNDIPSSNGSLDNDRLIYVHHHANSPANFAVRLVRELFDSNELIGRNVTGVRGKQQLDPVRVERIMGLVHQFYPAPPSEKIEIARKCRKGIDSYLRKLK